MISVAMAETLKVKKLAGALGDRIEGIDLADDIDVELLEILRKLFLEHLLLVFPNQGRLTPEQQVKFAGRWGVLQRSNARSDKPYFAGLA